MLLQVGVEASGLRLLEGQLLLLGLLLGLLLAIRIHIHGLAEAGVEVRLEASGLSLLREPGIGIGHVASVLGLILVDGVCEEVDWVSLLVSLVEASVLRLAGLLLRDRIIIEERVSIALFQLLAPLFLLLLAKLDRLLQVIIIIHPMLSALSLFPVFLLLILAGLDSQAVLGIFLIIRHPPLALAPVPMCGGGLGVLGGELLESGNARLPGSPIASLSS